MKMYYFDGHLSIHKKKLPLKLNKLNLNFQRNFSGFTCSHLYMAAFERIFQ